MTLVSISGKTSYHGARIHTISACVYAQACLHIHFNISNMEKMCFPPTGIRAGVSSNRVSRLIFKQRVESLIPESRFLTACEDGCTYALPRMT